MAVKLDALKEYIRTGNKDALGAVATQDNGGYIVTGYFIKPRKGFMGWVYRLIKDKRGWIETNFYQQIMDEARFAKFNFRIDVCVEEEISEALRRIK